MITIFYGDIGKGKTLSAVLLAEFLRDMKIKQKRKYKVFDNCEYKHSTNSFYDYFSKDNLNDLETDKILIFDVSIFPKKQYSYFHLFTLLFLLFQYRNFLYILFE